MRKAAIQTPYVTGISHTGFKAVGSPREVLSVKKRALESWQRLVKFHAACSWWQPKPKPN